jgi:DNA-binding transcriptional regulator YiaG
VAQSNSTTGRKKTRAKTNAAGRELLGAVRQAHRAVTTGDFTGITIRQVEIPSPGEYGPKEVRALRQTLGVSHRVFAELVGVSRELVAQWEYGTRHPAPLARRLLDKINEDPARYFDSLVKHRKLATRNPSARSVGRVRSPANP